MSNPSIEERSNPSTIETATSKRYKRRLAAREQAASEQQSVTNTATPKASKRRKKKKGKRRPREQMRPRAMLSTDCVRRAILSRNSDDAIPAPAEMPDGSSPAILSRATGSSHQPENNQESNSMPPSYGEAIGSRPLPVGIGTILRQCAVNAVAAGASTQPTSSRQEGPVQVASEQHSVSSSDTMPKASTHTKKNAKHRPRGTIPHSRISIERLPALVEPDDGSSPSLSGRITGTVPHPKDGQPINLGQTDMEAGSPLHPSSHSNMHEGTYRHERNPQPVSGEPTPSSSYPTPSGSIMECAARTTSRDTSNQAQGTSTDLSEVGDWRIVHEAGYCPIMSSSYVPPMKKDVGVFPSRSAAVRHGQQLVGSIGGYAWSQVRDSGDLEIVAATSSRWEICWKPPDSEYSRVTATLLEPGGGRWVVDVERGYIPDGAHSYVAPTKNTLGPFQSREIAVARAKKEVGGKRGLRWFEVLRGGDFENREDSANRWEGYWEPPDSEYSHVIVKMLVPATSADSGNGTSASVGNSWNDDQQPSSTRADLKQTAFMSSSAELPLAF